VDRGPRELRRHAAGGPFFGEDHAGVQLRVEDFQATYRTTGQPQDFVTRAELLDADGDPVEEVEIRVNHPRSSEASSSTSSVRVGARDQRRAGWGADRGRPGRLPAGRPAGGREPLQLPWNCVVKLPTLDPQVGSGSSCGLTAEGSSRCSRRVERCRCWSVRTVMTFEAFEGDLRAELVRTRAPRHRRDAPLRDRSARSRGDRGSRDGLTVTFPSSGSTPC